ncbi:hypothetical protein [Actinomadura sp. DC4]|uniref:hypothetical protein n=1 Tax=Actinomadura sp. DC4 TaxID=3055069 RepID=UPI0025B230CE|nr:hypothetical protein [Actinomadura sp. DC4]MDN3358708.1 hypothetical protein [Actinomadura sp. DC4]
MAVSDREPSRTPAHWARYALIAVLLVAGGLAAAVLTRPGSGAVARLRDMLEYVAGVFALLALTEAVLSGVAAAEALVPVRFRLVIQSTHRATTVIAIGFLAAHVALKINEGHAALLDAVVPFSSGRGRSVWIGLGTLASDLLLLVVVTGLLRARFAAGRWPWLWRTFHVAAYAMWPLAVLHGLMAGRAAKTWVVLGYAVCAAAILLAVASRLPRLVRERRVVSERISEPYAPVPSLMDGGDAGPARTAGRPGDRR